MSWKRLDRKSIYESEYLKVYEDTVELPNGIVKEKYSIVELPEIVVIVATDDQGHVLTLNEYKYGMDKVTRVFPAGHLDDRESPVEAGKRELLEETGYGEGEFTYIGVAHEFPTKIIGNMYVVRAKGVKKIGNQHLDADEAVELKVISTDELKEEVARNEWQTSAALCALAISGILNP